MKELDYLRTFSSNQRQLKFRKTLAKIYLVFLLLSQHRGEEEYTQIKILILLSLGASQAVTCLLVLTEHLISALLAYYVIILSPLQNNVIRAKPQ